MSLKNTSLFGVILALLLMLGVGEMWGASTVNGGHVYFDVSQSGWGSPSSVEYIISHDNYSCWYAMENIANTKLYYISSASWEDAKYIAFTANYGWTSCEENSYDNRKGYGPSGSKRTAKSTYGVNSGSTYLFYASSSTNDAAITTSSPAGYLSEGYSALNSTQTIKSQLSTDGGSTYSDANSKATISITSYAMTGDGAATEKTASISTSAQSTTVSAARTATTTLSIGDVAPGYEFVGWYVGSMQKSTSASYTYYPKAATTVVARFKETRYEVKVATITPSAGGDATPTNWTYMGQDSGGDITATPNTGYSFSGWSILSGGGGYFGTTGTANTSTTANTKFRPTKTSSLKATFTANSYTFTLNGNGGSDGSVTIQYDSDTPTAISGASRAGFSLNGYYTAASGGNKVINADGSLNNVSGWVSGGCWKQTDDTQVLYAQWTVSAVYYTLNFSPGRSLTDYVSVAAKNTDTQVAISDGASLVSGTGVTLTATPETHYRFVGWYSNALCTSFVSSSNPYSFGITADTKLYAKVELMTTAITLNANGGSGGTTSVTATHGSRDLSSRITKPTRAGYTFDGWYSAESGGTEIITKSGFTTTSVTDWTENGGYWKYTGSTLTLYAHWTEKMSTLTTSNHYNAGDPGYAAPTVSGSATTVGYATTRTITATAAGTGYTFTGWTLTNCTRTDGGAATATSITIRSNGDGSAASVVANYAEDRSSRWHLVGNSTDFPDGWNVSLANMMQKKVGHSTESAVYFTINVTSTDTKEFKIVDDNDGSGNIWYGYSNEAQYQRNWTNTNTYTIYNGSGNSQSLKYTPTVTGPYEFKVDYSDAANVAVTITYPTPYTVTYSVSPDGAGGAITTSPSVSSGGKIAAGTSVTFTRGDANAGYEWYRWEDGSGSELGTDDKYTTTINANTTVVAKYTENTYNVTATASAGGSATPTSATSMGQITGGDITATPYTGYNFTDWTITSGTGYFGASGTSTTSTTANTKFRPTAAATVKATFAPKTTTITLNNQDATTPGTTEVTATYDAAMPAITPPTKTGYTFGGYFGAPGGEAPKYYNTDGSSTQNWNNVDATYTLYAKWTANGYTVTINVDEENKGTITSATTSQSVTYGAALTTIPHLPTAADGYGLDGYYTDHNGAGTKVINGDGTWIASVDGYTDADTKWIHADNVTLYAYYKQAEITELTLVETIVGTAGTDSITVTPVIAPLPAGITIVCWEVQYSNGTALPSQPAGRLVSGNTYRFKAPTASATYRIQATLRSGSSCGGGSVLSTRATTFQVAGDHTVTVQYKCGDVTIKAATEMTARPLVWSGAITAPNDIFGYTFSSWTAGDGVTITDDDGETTKAESSNATIKVKATYGGTLTANYTQKSLIYFKNTLGWSSVYVNFLSDEGYWAYGNDAGKGSGNSGVTNRNLAMSLVEGTTDIYYYDYGTAGITPKHYVSFTQESMDGYDFFYQGDQKFAHVVYPTRPSDDLNADDKYGRGFYAATPMFVPRAVGENEGISQNNGGAKYYNDGYWTKFTAGTGYTLEVYSTDGNALLKSVAFTSADDLMPMKAFADLEAGATYKFQLKRDGDVYYGHGGIMTHNNHGQGTGWEFTNSGFTMCTITTTAAGNYTFNLSYSADANNKYRLRIAVDYPVATGDYRIMYQDHANWSQTSPHSPAWGHPSSVITKNSSATEPKADTVSLYVACGSSPSAKFQKATVDPETGAISWADIDGGTIDLSGITEKGVYNFIVSQPANGTAISLTKTEAYTGNYYIRTDCVGGGKWDNFRGDINHLMTFSDYAATQSEVAGNTGFTHYLAHWVTNGTNVKFTIANDYSQCITDTLAEDLGTVIATIDASGYLTSASANIRFMWNQVTNKLSRAYIAGSGNITERFLVLEGDAKMYDENGNALTGEHQDHNQYGTKLGTDNQVIMHDKENFVYERTIQVNTKARARLSAAYNGKTQYFIGSSGDFAEGTTVELLGGAESDTKYTMRIVYDFKTNRLVTAYMPSGAAITENLAINADIMLVREHQNAGQQLTFESEGSLSEVKTVYGVMRFNRWTLNNKSTAAGHAPVGDPKSTYERSLYWISFPFNVNLSDVFGFGTYGTHWIIEYYDGAERATEGYWADSEGFWKYVTNRNGYMLEAGKGYILALDLDLMRDDNTSFWANNIEQVELFFPSAAAVGNIQKTNTEINIPAHECTIAARPGMSDDRTKKDSHWNIIGVPSYANYGSELKDGSNVTITWNDNLATEDLPFLYEWNMVDNTYSVQSGTTYPFKSMHAYMVQYNGKLKWSLASATPASPVIARQTDAPKDVEFRIELQQGEATADQTFVKMSTNEQISTAFDFNYDLSKQMNSGKANIYTMVEGYIQTAGNCLPMSEQTTVVPVGVKIAADGDYTFAIPDGTAGIGVTLIDTETGIRTNLSALTYTIALTAGTYDNRFVLEFSPIRNVPTEQPDVRSQKSEVSKVLIDGLLYIVRDNKMYDARGAMIMEK